MHHQHVIAFTSLSQTSQMSHDLHRLTILYRNDHRAVTRASNSQGCHSNFLERNENLDGVFSLKYMYSKTGQQDLVLVVVVVVVVVMVVVVVVVVVMVVVVVVVVVMVVVVVVVVVVVDRSARLTKLT
ncbi:hypothetical protein ElyMa_006603100 [Elysia marginata]|uniref:Uncharacterized protein n=1 Tax=Elysia marginata TaxID=1093978 RepID=A0AAV4IJ37_9GAST|nr:hypothetical protein ElyMa_006603100 [Elysia marginata]